MNKCKKKKKQLFSTPINMQNLDFAVSLVSLDTEIVSEKKVYNLTVKNHHEYFANNILVSNCDALLYAWRSCYHYLSVREPIKLNKNTDDYMNYLEEEESNGKEKETWYRRN
jgi:hypothetical protein